jgi:hypothetical protein
VTLQSWFFAAARHLQRVTLFMLGHRDVQPRLAYAYVPLRARTERRFIPAQRARF